MRVSPYRQSHSRPTAKNSENLRKGLPNIDELGLQNPSGKQKVRRIGVMLLVVVLVAGVAHYFIHEYPGKVAVALPQAIARHNLTDFPLEDFIRRYEEKIMQELSLIIVRKNLAPFALRRAQWEKVDQQNLIMRNEIKGSEE